MQAQQPGPSPAHSATLRKEPSKHDVSVLGNHWKAFQEAWGSKGEKVLFSLSFFFTPKIHKTNEGRQTDKKSTQQLLVVFQVIPQIFYNVFNTFELLKYLNYEYSY